MNRKRTAVPNRFTKNNKTTSHHQAATSNPKGPKPVLLSCPPQAREHRGVRALFWSPGREKIAANTQLAMLDKVATKDHRHQATARWTNTDTQRGRGGQADRTRDHTQADATHKCTHARTHARTHTHTRDTENTHIPRYKNRQTNASHHGNQSGSSGPEVPFARSPERRCPTSSRPTSVHATNTSIRNGNFKSSPL